MSALPFFPHQSPRRFSVVLTFVESQLSDALIFLFGFSFLCFADLCSDLYCPHTHGCAERLTLQAPWCPVSVPGAPAVLSASCGFSPSLGQQPGAVLCSPSSFSLPRGSCPLLTRARYLENSCFMYFVSFLVVSDRGGGLAPVIPSLLVIL